MVLLLRIHRWYSFTLFYRSLWIAGSNSLQNSYELHTWYFLICLILMVPMGGGDFQVTPPKVCKSPQHIQSLTSLDRTEPNLWYEKSSNMQGRVCLSRIIQFASDDFVTNIPLILFTYRILVALNLRSGLLMKQLWITHLIFLNIHHFHGSSGCGSMMRSSKPISYVYG